MTRIDARAGFLWIAPVPDWPVRIEADTRDEARWQHARLVGRLMGP
jgi:hypothetical protein